MYTEVSMSLERISSREFEDEIIALLASKAIIPVDLRLRSLIDFDIQANDTNLYTAIIRALREDGLEEWANLDSPAPDAVVLYPDIVDTLIQTESYLSQKDLFRTLIGVTDSYGKDVYNNPASRSLVRKVWKQITPRFMPKLALEIARAGIQKSEQEKVSYLIGSVSLRADAIYGLLIDSYDEYRALLKGTGDIGRSIIPAAMFQSGDYPELFTYMEQFEDATMELFPPK